MTQQATGDPPRTRNADATRAALLEAATKRFTVLGYERTTTRDIAAEAGVNVSLIARYFGSKDGLFAEVLRESADALENVPSGNELDLVASVVDGLRSDRWPEFGGEHPLLLLVRGVHDEKVGALRRRSLATVNRLLTERLDGTTGTRTRGKGTLRGDALLAVVVGLLTVRSARPDGPLASADDDTLHRLVGQLVGAVADC